MAPVKRKKYPAYQAYPNDLLGDPCFRRMSPDAQAFYRLLLDNIWVHDTQYSIPDDDEMIAAILGIKRARWEKMKKEILSPNKPLLGQKNGRLISRRLQAERRKQDKFHRAQSDRGKASAAARANRGSTVVQPAFNHSPVEPTRVNPSFTFTSSIEDNVNVGANAPGNRNDPQATALLIAERLRAIAGDRSTARHKNHRYYVKLAGELTMPQIERAITAARDASTEKGVDVFAYFGRVAETLRRNG